MAINVTFQQRWGCALSVTSESFENLAHKRMEIIWPRMDRASIAAVIHAFLGSEIIHESALGSRESFNWGAVGMKMM